MTPKQRKKIHVPAVLAVVTLMGAASTALVAASCGSDPQPCAGGGGKGGAGGAGGAGEGCESGGGTPPDAVG